MHPGKEQQFLADGIDRKNRLYDVFSQRTGLLSRWGLLQKQAV